VIPSPSSSAAVDVEQIETTKGEKLLAAVLALFLLIGGVWLYQEIDDQVRQAMPARAEPTAEDAAALRRARESENRLGMAQRERAQARDRLELRREEYRAELDAGRAAPALEQAYRAAQADFARAETELEAARREVERARPAAAAAAERQADELAREQRRQALVIFFVRLVTVLALVALGYWGLASLRGRGSRWYPLSLAFVASAALLAFVMAGDYVTDYVDPLELGPLVLSLAGIGMTLVAFAALQRYLERRLPLRRVRKRECPFCGFPVRDTARCEGCGREVVHACPACGSPRRVGSPHCGVCGAAGSLTT
jgi:hypothetical protein